MFSNLVEILRFRAGNAGARRAFSFLSDAGEPTLTYADLDRRARAVAARLQARSGAGQRAVLLYPPGLDYVAAFFGCLYAGITAVPAYPLRTRRMISRLRAIIADSEARFVLAAPEAVPPLSAEFANAGAQVEFLSVEECDSADADAWRDPHVGPDTLAFLQYTSGSTGAPKGVMVTHGNLIYNSDLIRNSFEHTEDTRLVMWLPPYHDMGLIGGLVQPLYAGFPVTLFSPFAFLQRPMLWLETITRDRATTSGAPDFAYRLCVERASPEQVAKLDLSSWDLAFCGAEPVRSETLRQFCRTFGPCGFRAKAFFPCYGLAEATLIVSGGRKSAEPVIECFRGTALNARRVEETGGMDEDRRELVGCGGTLGAQQIQIVDPDTRIPCPPGEVGEIWVSGPSVASGYWRRADETQAAFCAYRADTGEGPYLRTGDLGFLRGGELFIAGRIKDLVIVAGANYYPQDIEFSAEKSHPAFRAGSSAAFAVENGSGEQLVVALEVERRFRGNVSVKELNAAVRRAVSEDHQIRVHTVVLLKAGAIPKTSSGKVQRSACRAAWVAGELETWEPGPGGGEIFVAHSAEVQ